MILWNEERDAILRQKVTEGLSARQIAAIFGDVTRNAVIGRVHRLGLGMVRTKSKGNPENRHRRKVRRTAQVKPRPVFAAPPQLEEGADPVYLLDLQWWHCRAVIGDPSEAMFCGHPTVYETSWCQKHHAVFTVPSSRSAPRVHWKAWQ